MEEDRFPESLTMGERLNPGYDPKEAATLLLREQAVIGPHGKEGSNLLSYHCETLGNYSKWWGLTFDQAREIIKSKKPIDLAGKNLYPKLELQESLLKALDLIESLPHK